MSVDVTSAIVIRRPRDEVAAFAIDPDNAPLGQQVDIAGHRRPIILAN